MNTYLVTGATGVVGSAITEALAARPDARMKLLIRADSPAKLQERVDGLIKFWGVDAAAVAPRVEGLIGDTSEPNLGLDDETYARVAAECTHVIHSAGAVRMNLSIEDARHSAVDGAKNIVAFARAARSLQKVEFISTVGVGGRLRGSVPERWINEAREFHNTYEQAKAEGETLLEQAIRDGLPITVHRPSMVVGNSKTGKVIHFQVFYHLAEFLSGQKTFGICPDPGPTKLDLVAADHVADAVLWSAGERSTTGRIFHLCAGPSGALGIQALRQQVCSIFKAQGIKLPSARTVPAGLFRAAIPVVGMVSSERDRRALSTLPIFLDYLQENQTFANTDTTKILHQARIATPAPASFVSKVLEYYLARRKTRRN